MLLHRHHTIPRHAGGDDSPVVLLTIEEHAEAHRLLWEQHGRWQDYLAWKGLSGSISGQEVHRLAMIENGKRVAKFLEPYRGTKPSRKTRQKLREAMIRRGPPRIAPEIYARIAAANTGQTRSDKTRKRIGIAARRSWETGDRQPHGPHALETRESISTSRKKWAQSARHARICESCGRKFNSISARWCSSTCRMRNWREKCR